MSEEKPKPQKNGQRFFSPQKKGALIILLMAAMAVCFGGSWIIETRSNLSTDNAFIESNIHPVSSRITGTVTGVYVKDNQMVKKGELLVALDPADYRAASEKAAASVSVAANETSGDRLQVASAKAVVESAKARHEQATTDLRRGEALYAREVIPKEQLDRLKTGQRVADAQLQEAKEQLGKAQAIAGDYNKAGSVARVRQKQAELAESRLKLGYTKITAPADGYITRKGVETGATIQPGQALMAVVPLDGSWITANYKESQITHIRPGQKVSFRVDAYPGQIFSGAVDSLMAGTGAAFSLLPPENATGNYVKVVQRIPVKILIDHKTDPDHFLRVGMSVTPTIHTGRTSSQVLRELVPFM